MPWSFLAAVRGPIIAERPTAKFTISWPILLGGPDDPADGSLPDIDNLALVDAVELSLIHSRDYQTQLENLYLAALSLTYERYRFDVRPTGILGEPGTGLFFQHQPEDRSDLSLGPTNLGISRLLPSGGQFVAELANNTLWMFSGPNATGTATTIAYSLVQPLLRGAGREIALEDLTQAERNVVYAMRDFARFRKQFFVNTITGGQVAADALEADLDLVVEGEVNTPPLESNGKPFGLRSRESQFRVGLGFTTPLDRRAERNNFRASQIGYQQARRGYMAAEDQIQLEVRQSVRTLDELKVNIVQARRRVQFSARELDLAETQAGLAQRGLSLTTALRGLNRAQDELIENWLDYETTRLNFFRDVGTMQIDEHGFWLDSFYRRMIESHDHPPGKPAG